MSGRTLTSKKTIWIGALASAPLVVPLGSIAEESVRATLGITNRLESVSESGFTRPQNEGERFVTVLDFGLTAQNNNHELAFSANTGFSYNSNTAIADQYEMEDPFLQLIYGFVGRHSSLDINASYRRTEIDNANFFDVFDTEDVETGEGDRTTFTVNTGFVLGREAPITLRLDNLYARNTFEGGTDGNISDSTTNRLGADLSFQLNPVLSTAVFGNWSETNRDAPGAADQTSSAIGVRAAYAVSEILTFTGSVSYDEAKSTNSVNDSSGIGYTVGLEREMPNGSISFDLTRTERVSGSLEEAVVGRTMALQRGSLRYSLGLTRTDNSDVRPLANVAYSHNVTPSSQFNISLRQSSQIDGDDNETVRTNLSVGYTYDINSVSSLTASTNFASQNALDEGTDRSSISASLTYRHEVGNDWDMITGYRYTESREDNRQNRSSDTIFVGLEKKFDWRP